jgi:transcriptional regulator GlxA family with amidase domain
MLYSADGQNVVSSTGMRFGVDAAARDSGPLDIALVAGTDDFPAHPVSPELAEAARTLVTRARRTASICTGTFILAAAGLLDGRRATTHWHETTALARAHPAIEVVPDAIYVEDGQMFSVTRLAPPHCHSLNPDQLRVPITGLLCSIAAIISASAANA